MNGEVPRMEAVTSPAQEAEPQVSHPTETEKVMAPSFATVTFEQEPGTEVYGEVGCTTLDIRDQFILQVLTNINPYQMLPGVTSLGKNLCKILKDDEKMLVTSEVFFSVKDI